VKLCRHFFLLERVLQRPARFTPPEMHAEESLTRRQKKNLQNSAILLLFSRSSNAVHSI
jgi:hypothetical protein